MRAKKHNKSISGGSPAPNYQLLLMSILITILVIFFIIPLNQDNKLKKLDNIGDSTETLFIVPRELIKDNVMIAHGMQDLTQYKSQDLDPNMLVVAAKMHIIDINCPITTGDNDSIPVALSIENPPQIPNQNYVEFCKQNNIGMAF